MKISWTLSLAAVALVMGVFPAFANQGQPKPKSSEQKKTERKIDAASLTPFMTPHQGNTLKKAVNGGEQMKQDEKLAYPAPGQATTPGASQGTPGQTLPNAKPNENPNPEAGKAEAPKEEPKPSFRLVGTVCGKGKDLAVFDTGADWPSMLTAGEKLADGTLIISVDRGRVCLERTIMAAQPAIPAQEAELAEDGSELKPAVPGRKAQPEKRERYVLYTW
jgi:hypothetical protein